MKKLISILLVVMMTIPLFACNKDDELEKVDGKKTSYSDITLRVLDTIVAPKGAKQGRHSVAERGLLKEYPGVKFQYVTKETYKLDDNQAFANKINSETMAGKGPDIFIFNSGKNGGSEHFGDVYKTAKAGAFADLNEFMQADKTFVREDYLESALKGGEFDGKQHLLPVSISMPTLITTSEIAEQKKLNLDSLNTSTGLMTELGNYMKNRPATETEIAIEGKLDEMVHLTNLLDYNNNTVNIDTPNTKAFFETYKALRSQNNRVPSSGISCAESLLSNEIVMNFSNSPYSVLDTMAVLNGTETPALLPTYNSVGQTQAELASVVAVGSTSENKKIAFAYAKYLSRGDEPNHLKQRKPHLRNSGSLSAYKPLHNYCSESYKENYSLGLAINSAKSVPIEPFPQEYFDRFNDIYNNIEVCTLYSRGDNMVLDYLQPYFDDKASLDDCLKKAQSAMEIYISE